MTAVILETSMAFMVKGSTYPEAKHKGDRIELDDAEAQRYLERGLARPVAVGRSAETAVAATPENAAQPKPAKRGKPAK